MTITPTYSGCPATSVIALAIESALRAKGVEDFRLERRISPPWTTDWISAEGRQQLKEYGIAPPPEKAGNRVAAEPARPQDRDGRMPSLRFSEHGAGQRVRLDAVQGTIPVPGLPGAVRLFQVHLAGRRHGDVSSPHGDRRPSRDPGLRGAVARRSRGAQGGVPLHARAVSHLSRLDRRRGGAPLLFDLRRRARAGAPRRDQEGRRTGCSRPGPTSRCEPGSSSKPCRRWATSSCRSTRRTASTTSVSPSGSGITPLLSIIKTTLVDRAA